VEMIGDEQGKDVRARLLNRMLIGPQ
jgi:hypothetical protein